MVDGVYKTVLQNEDPGRMHSKVPARASWSTPVCTNNSAVMTPRWGCTIKTTDMIIVSSAEWMHPLLSYFLHYCIMLIWERFYKIGHGSPSHLARLNTNIFINLFEENAYIVIPIFLDGKMSIKVEFEQKQVDCQIWIVNSADTYLVVSRYLTTCYRPRSHLSSSKVR